VNQLSESTAVPCRRSITRTADDLKIKRLVVAVHGVGSQYRYATIQAVASRFAAYCKQPMTLPLGAFHSDRLIRKFDSPELGAYPFGPPPDYTTAFSGLGFAEAFWADIPERAADTKNTTEESKAWARTIVDRLRILDEANKGTESNLVDYNKASTIITEMIDTIAVLENILSLASKAGLFDFKLGQLLTDFLGDVQIVADFKDYGGDVFQRFAITLHHLADRMPNLEQIYIVAHSEGTVVALRGLLLALSAEEEEHNKWAKLVKGIMTIGSPLNKHIVLWPSLWQELKPSCARIFGEPIVWRNYYDLGDPIGFDLEITRDWLRQNGWLSSTGAPAIFQFAGTHDYGFVRYPFPGKAHNDYWDDPEVFGNFIDGVILRNDKDCKIHGKFWARIVSWIVPYLLCVALLATGTYILYKTLIGVLRMKENLLTMTQNVSGITCYVAGITLLSRMPRLDKIWPPWPGTFIGIFGFTVGAIAFYHLTTDDTQRSLSAPFGDSAYGILWVGLLIGVISGILGKAAPQFGMKPLISLGGIVAFMILWHLISHLQDYSLWPLVLANAAFLYLWWLTALLFDLSYIWHQFIRSSRTTKTLQKIRAGAVRTSALKA
jgi:hypothetical protein